MKIILLIITTVLILALAKPAQACSVCFGGDPNAAALQGIKWGILVLLSILAGVVSLFVLFFHNFNKRAQKTVE